MKILDMLALGTCLITLGCATETGSSNTPPTPTPTPAPTDRAEHVNPPKSPKAAPPARPSKQATADAPALLVAPGVSAPAPAASSNAKAPDAPPPKPRFVLAPLPTTLGPLGLGKKPPAECFDAVADDESSICRTPGHAVIVELATALDAPVVSAGVTLRGGLVASFNVSISGCSLHSGDTVGEQLRHRFGLSRRSDRRPEWPGWIERTDARGTVVRLAGEEGGRCFVTWSAGSTEARHDTTRSDGEIQGDPIEPEAPVAHGKPIVGIDGQIRAALLRADGLTVAIRSGSAEDGHLELRTLVAGETGWTARGAPLRVPTRSWGAPPSMRTPPEPILYAVGEHWLVVETRQKLCFGGSDPCHIHRTGHVVGRVDGRLALLGELPVDVTGPYGSETCQYHHIGFDRGVIEATPERLALSLVPARTRALCNPSLETCHQGPVERLRPATPLELTVVVTRDGLKKTLPPVAELARRVAEWPAGEGRAELLTSLAELAAGPGFGAELHPIAAAYACLGGSEGGAPDDVRSAVIGRARVAIEHRRVKPATRTRLSARLERITDP